MKKFDYKGADISFEFEDSNRMINATEMAKPFGKPVANFLRLAETKHYVQILESRYSDVNIGKKKEVLRVVKGGNEKSKQGTWMDEKLALKFASWLSPEFEVWVYERIQELLHTGKTEIADRYQVSPIIKSLQLIVEQLAEHDRSIAKLEGDMDSVKDYVSDMKTHIENIEAKITSIDENYYSVSGYCALNGIPCPLAKAQSWGYAATKLSNQKKMPIGKAYDAKYGEVNTYHLDILKLVVK